MPHEEPTASAPPPHPTVRVGPHTIMFEPPDVVHIVMGGEFTVPHIRQWIELVTAHAEGKSHLLALVDLATFSISLEGRKVVAFEARHIPFRGIATYHGSFQARVLAKLVGTAHRLMAKLPTASCFTTTEAEARAWIKERQRTIAAERRG